MRLKKFTCNTWLARKIMFLKLVFFKTIFPIKRQGVNLSVGNSSWHSAPFISQLLGLERECCLIRFFLTQRQQQIQDSSSKTHLVLLDPNQKTCECRILWKLEQGGNPQQSVLSGQIRRLVLSDQQFHISSQSTGAAR